MNRERSLIHPFRLALVLSVLVAATGALGWRALDLQVMNRAFLQDQGDARHLRAHVMPAHRGMITDRHGDPLAVSIPVDSIWGNPQELVESRERWPELAAALGVGVKDLGSRIEQRAGREFVYLRRHVDPPVAERVMALGLRGVSLQREYRRYYPEGEVSAHLVGLTNIDDQGQEGFELAYDRWLQGRSGAKWVLKDRYGRIVEDVAGIKEPEPGQDLRLSIDRRIQYLTYRELKTAVQLHRAESGSVVVLDVRTGEVLAMANQPSFNPNNRGSMRADTFRNRAVTDLIEPGSTAKPFTIAAALEAGSHRPESLINTAPGFFRVGNSTIRDLSNYGAIDLTTVIQKSSNVGMTKIALALPPERMWQMFSAVGFGGLSGTGFPGEAVGTLSHHSRWRELERATLSFGYGLSVTPLQLAQAYAVLGDHGRFKPTGFIATGDAPPVMQAMSPRTANEVLRMMESVVSSQGTGVLARVSGYRVAGKTGTVMAIGGRGYSEDNYISLFAGIAPVAEPRLAMVVVIHKPGGEEYYGGRVAAPVFSKTMTGALRMLGVTPDDVPGRRLQVDAPRPAGDQPAPLDAARVNAAEPIPGPTLVAGKEVL
jgi:cell division protein FtsI (penicillin-binding protein 3)